MTLSQDSASPPERMQASDDIAFLESLAAKFERDTQVYLGHVNAIRAERLRGIIQRHVQVREITEQRDTLAAAGREAGYRIGDLEGELVIANQEVCFANERHERTLTTLRAREGELSTAQAALEEAQTVYVLERGVDYEGNDVLGVFATLDEAKAACPGVEFAEMEYGKPSNGRVFWRAYRPFNRETWIGGDWIDITPYRLDDLQGGGVQSSAPGKRSRP